MMISKAPSIGARRHWCDLKKKKKKPLAGRSDKGDVWFSVKSDMRGSNLTNFLKKSCRETKSVNVSIIPFQQEIGLGWSRTLFMGCIHIWFEYGNSVAWLAHAGLCACTCNPIMAPPRKPTTILCNYRVWTICVKQTNF